MTHSKNLYDRLLIVDGDQGTADYLANVATQCGFSVTVATGFNEFQCAYFAIDPTVVLLNMHMPDCDGIKVLRVLGDVSSNARVILVSEADSRTSRTAAELGKVLGLEMSSPLQVPLSIFVFKQSLLQHKVGDESFSVEHLQRAIDDNQIRPHYQPEARLEGLGDWVIDEVEALARWYIADTEILLPETFLSPVDESGLLPAMTECMLRQVVIQLRAWREGGLVMTASVNISPSMLADRDLPERLDALTSEAGVSNRQLTLETTENVMLEYSAETVDVLDRLRVRDFGLALDGFGTGYSSLRELKRMPFSELKIDRSIVKDSHCDEEASAVVETTVAIAQKLRMRVCAVGVESRLTFDYLESVGCNKQQGYVIGPPGAAATVPTALEKWRAELLSAMPSPGHPSPEQYPDL